MATLKRTASVDSEEAVEVKRPSPEMRDESDSWIENHYSVVPENAGDSEERMKWKGGKLQIFQIENGFSFIYYLCDNAHPARAERQRHQRLVGYRYDWTMNDGEDGYTESRSFVSGNFNGDKVHHGQQLPDQLIEVLGELLQTYHASFVKLQFLVLDLKSLAKLEWALADRGCNYLEMGSVRFDAITDSHRKRFVALIRASCVRFLEMNGDDQALSQGLQNEEFIIDMAGTQLERFQSDVRPGTVFAHRFTASQQILPALCSFQTFDAPSLIISRDWFIPLLMDFMDAIDPSLTFLDFYWRFAIDAYLTTRETEARIRKPQYEFYVEKGKCVLKKRSTMTVARWGYTQLQDGDGGTTGMIIVKVVFTLEKGEKKVHFQS